MSPLDQVLIDMMIDEITLEPCTGKDKFNNLTFGPSVKVQCQIVRANIASRTAAAGQRALAREGRETMSTVQVILATPEMTVTDNDRITLPDGTQPAIIEVLAANDEVGPYYLEIRA